MRRFLLPLAVVVGLMGCGARHTPPATAYAHAASPTIASAPSAAPVVGASSVASVGSAAPSGASPNGASPASSTAASPPDHGVPTGDADFKNSAAALGKKPPELTVDAWVGSSEPLLLRELEGRAVLVVFCALDDSRCDGAHEQMKQLHEKWGTRKDFVEIELFADQAFDEAGTRIIGQSIAGRGFPWPAGYGAKVQYARLRYGYPDLPAAYLVDRDGKVVWSGRIGRADVTLPRAIEVVMAAPP